jgi:predicted kinase
VPTHPAVIVLSGPPATGKSTLARALAARLTMPILSRDTIKEALFDTLGWEDRKKSKQLGAAAATVLFSQLDAILRAGASCLTESNFRRTHSSGDFRRLVATIGARIIQVQCVADGEVLLDRFTARSTSVERHPGHCDETNLPEFRSDLLAGRYEPLDVPGDVLTVDTTDLDAVSVDELAAQLSTLLDHTPPRHHAARLRHHARRRGLHGQNPTPHSTSRVLQQRAVPSPARGRDAGVAEFHHATVRAWPVSRACRCARTRHAAEQ